jgi:peptidoglycan/LPS O-acetylase OafA/YrhL
VSKAALAHRSSVAHVRSLDGLRGVALLGVVAFHLSSLEGGERAGVLGGGWLGVDLFFTLSGYLITSLLLAEVEATRRVDLRAFWRRRVRRLQPAALVAITATVLTAAWWSAPGTARVVRNEALAALSGVANWQFLWAERPYAAGNSPSGFEHFWSLAVEEQFYVVWPLAIALLARLVGGRRRRLGHVVLGVSAAGIAGSWLLLATQPLQRAYLGTDARMGAILLGCALSVLLPLERFERVALARSRAGWLTVLGLGVSAALWLLAGWPPKLSLAVVLPLQGLATVATLAGLVLAPQSAPSRLLGTRALVGIGRVSYGAYLWHWPVFVLLTPERVGGGWLLTTAVRLAVVTALTLLSWRLVEGPVRLNLVLPRTRVALPVVAIAVAGIAVLSARAVAPTPAWARSDGRLVVGRTAPASASLPAASPNPPKRVLVVGDSIATSLVSGPTETLQAGTGHLMERLAERGIASAAATIAGCPVAEMAFVAESGVNRSCIELQRKRLPPAMEEFRPDLIVWYSRQEAYPIQLDDGRTTDDAGERRARYEARLRWFAERGAKVLLVSPGPNGAGHESEAPLGRPESMVELDRTIAEVARANPDVVVGAVHMREVLCNGARRGCPDRRPDGGRYRIDGIHYLGPGEELVSEWLAARIAAIDLTPR